MFDHNRIAEPQTYLTVGEVAARYRKSKSSIWHWASEGHFGFPQPVVLAPRTTRWKLSDLIAWEQSRIGSEA